MSVVIEGYFDRTVMRNEKNGFAVFSISPEGEVNSEMINRYGSVTCKGIIPPFNRNEFVAITGEWNRDVYGPYLEIEKIEEGCKDKASSIRYLASGTIGLSYDKARLLVDTYGVDIYAFAERGDAIDKLAELIGLSKRKASVIVGSILSTKHWRELMDYGFDKDLSYNTISRLIKDYGFRAKDVLCSSPYEIGLKYGASFACCDAIAFDNGRSPLNRERINAVAKLCLKNEENRGHVFVYEKDFYAAVEMQLSKKSSFVVPTIVISSAITADKEVCIEEAEENRIYLYENKFAEQNIAKQIQRLQRTSVKLPYSDDIADYAESVCGVQFAPEQRESLSLLKNTGVAILTGGPGTGKTTVMKGIIAAYQKMNPTGRIKLCAPSGRAAQRMAESTGMEASTIHRLLEYRPFEGGAAAKKNEHDPIEAELIVVDEGSMVDLNIASLLLTAVKSGSLLLIAGDINQLQSVGAGDVLNDCIRCGSIPVVQLRKVYRQAADSPIVSNAYAINNGRANLVENKDFEIIESTSDAITEAVCSVVCLHHDPTNPFYTQVLCPTHKGAGGVAAINKLLQNKLNPPKAGQKTLLYGGNEYRVNDKIIMMKNNPTMDYYNGDIGVVKSVGETELLVTIQKKDILLGRENLDDIKLAYAMSIHKSQGSEFPITIISLPNCAMLQRNLLYTGVTRGKKAVIIVQEPGNIERCVMHCEVGKRNSRLAERIYETLERN